MNMKIKEKYTKGLKKVLKWLWRYNELYSIFLAFFIWWFSEPILRHFDPQMGSVGLGVLRDLLYTFMAGFLIHGVSWLMLKLVWPGAYRFKDNIFTSLFVNSNKSEKNLLTIWQKVVILLWVFSLYFLGFIALHRIVAGLV